MSTISEFLGKGVRKQIEDCCSGVGINVCIFLLHRYAKGFEEDKATALAAAVTNELFGVPPANELGREFLASNGPLVEAALQDVKHIPRICHVVSVFTHLLANANGYTGTVSADMILSWVKLEKMGITLPIERLTMPKTPEDMSRLAQEFEQCVIENYKL